MAALGRVHDRLAGTAGTVTYVVRGDRDLRERPLLHVEISGSLQMQCGLCLATFEYPLQLRSTVLLAQPGAVPEGDDDPESPEWVEAGPELDVLALVEDEILLGLPVSVRHAQEGCDSGTMAAAGRHAVDPRFAKLAGLLKPAGRKTGKTV